MRAFLELFFVIVFGLSIGGALSWYSIQNNNGFGALTIDQWTAWPLAGSSEADPYTKAKVAAEGEVPLGAGEGIAFHATLDSTGQPLSLNCQYTLKGNTPPARFWTISAHLPDGSPVKSGSGDASTLFSRTLVRTANGDVSMSVGPNLAAGNWLAVTGSGVFSLILRLYDSPVTSTSGIIDAQMPKITRLDCEQ